ncbi:hypothetical protein ACFL17_08520 [Pseudomonadota bacterium]
MNRAAEKVVRSFPLALTVVFIGALLLGVGTPVDAFESYLVIILIAAISTGSILLLYRKTANMNGKTLLIGLLLILLNYTVAYVCLNNWAAPNNLITLGAWFLTSSYIFCLAANIGGDSARRIWVLINIILVACFSVVPPNINGATLHLKRLPVPTGFGIHPTGDDFFRNTTQHTQHFEHSTSSKPLSISLQSPVSSNKETHIRVRAKPSRTSSLEIDGITLDSYVGYRRAALVEIWGEALWDIPIVFPAAKGSRSDVKRGLKMIVPGIVTLDLNLPISSRPPALSTKLKHMIRSIILWELVFFAFFLLAPVGRQR